MVMMLDKLTLESFTELIGKTFRLARTDADAMDLVLIEAHGLSSQSKTPGESRAPFSVVFLGPKGAVLPQRIYPLENASLGRIEIFLVPIAADADGVKYEAIFN
jgi:hypothetical protein